MRSGRNLYWVRRPRLNPIEPRDYCFLVLNPKIFYIRKGMGVKKPLDTNCPILKTVVHRFSQNSSPPRSKKGRVRRDPLTDNLGIIRLAQ